MTIRKLHSNNTSLSREDIATQYTDLFFDDVANSILLPDPSGLLETKIGSTGSSPIAAGLDIGTTVVQNNITFACTTGGGLAKPGGARTVERIESQTIGDKIRLTYKLAFAGGSAGVGQYLLSLPTGVTFNSTYHPAYTGANPWEGDVHIIGKYHIPATGGIVIPANWSNQIMVIPYTATTFRLLVTNNQAGSGYDWWKSNYYAASANLSLNLQFEIWR